jgi:hypothetical protein
VATIPVLLPFSLAATAIHPPYASFRAPSSVDDGGGGVNDFHKAWTSMSGDESSKTSPLLLDVATETVPGLGDQSRTDSPAVPHELAASLEPSLARLKSCYPA